MTNIPSSFATICTKQCKQELIGFLLSLSLHHTNSNVYVICDTATKKYIDESTPKPKLNIKWFLDLDKYSNYNREEMVRLNIWNDFQMAKATVIEKALEIEKDTLFLDSDTIILDKLEIESNYELGVSPQFITEDHVKKTGYYNGGMLWTNQKSLPNLWREYTKTSRYHDQASIEDLTKEFKFFEFGENYNLQTWRFLLGLEPSNKIVSYINININKLYYKDKPLKFIHTHFNLDRFKIINDFFINKMKEAKLYKELAIIYRVINDKWILKVPKQPITGLYFHKNDSFRELPLLFKLKNKDVEIDYPKNTNHCWLEPNILLYDRPTLEWLNNEVLKSSLVLLGNGDINIEGKKIKDLGLIVKPWIFWARRPMIMEKVINENKLLNYEERDIESIFIGNFENSVQEKFRSNNNWESVLSEYHCTKGSAHKFSHIEYLLKLRKSRYGLCLRGYGSKCHREVELMGLGTVPIVTDNVSISSYYDKPIENIHYVYAKNPEDAKNKIKTISKEKWTEMSLNCYEWYQRNVYSNYAWNNMISYILYDC